MSKQTEKEKRDEARRLRREGKAQPVGGAEVIGQAIGGVFALGFMGFVIFALGKCMGPGDPPTEEEIAQIEATRLANERVGRHCLSAWDGRHVRLVEAFKTTLKDPNSFEHDKTIIAPVDENGKHTLMMRYRAKNSFGGLVQGHVQAEIDNDTCAHEIIASD